MIQETLANLLKNHQLQKALNYWLDHQPSKKAEGDFWNYFISGDEILHNYRMISTDISRNAIDVDNIYLDTPYGASRYTLPTQSFITECLNHLNQKYNIKDPKLQLVIKKEA